MKNKYKYTLKAGCKVNLYFEIVAKREDGYHNIESLFIPLPQPFDVIYINWDRVFKIECSFKELEGENNILYRTYMLYGEVTDFWPNLSIYLEKHIPYGSGLGGGSSDAAVFLNFLHSQTPYNKRISFNKLLDLAKKIGADVPFFLINRPAWVKGIGDFVIPIQEEFQLPFDYMILICPSFRVSTKDAYNCWDNLGYPLTKLKNKFKKNLITKGQIFFNSFEKVLYSDKRYIELYKIKLDLLKLGVSSVVLTGSGSSMVACTNAENIVLQTCDWLKKKGWNCFVYNKLNWGVAKG